MNWGWHFSTLYDQAPENEPLHDFQHATFLIAALLFWWPVVGADPADGASPTRSASYLSWRCHRTRSWGSR